MTSKGVGLTVHDMHMKMAMIIFFAVLCQVYTSRALPRVYPELEGSRGEVISVNLRQIACSEPSQCLPEEYRNASVPTDIVNCAGGVCICSNCFVAAGTTCAISPCWNFENGSCIDGRTRSQVTATLLSAFLSSVGAANFYIGRYDLGAGQLAVFVFLVAAVAAVGIVLCCWCRVRGMDGDESGECDKCVARLCPCCCGEYEYETEDEGFLSSFCIMASCCIVSIVVVLALIPVAVWWLADLIIFALNPRIDGNGCSLVS